MLVVLLSLSLEKGDHWIRRKLQDYGDTTASKIVDALFKEVTVLGFIGLLLFFITHSGAATALAANVYGAGSDLHEGAEVLAETFETIHMVIFLLLCVLLFQSGVVLALTQQVSKAWGNYERTRSFGTEESSLETQFVKAGYIERVPRDDQPRGTELVLKRRYTYGGDFFERLHLRREYLTKLIMFRAIRHEFLFPRRQSRRSTARVPNPAIFSFESYILKCLGRTVLALVEVETDTWLISLAVLVPIVFACTGASAVTVKAIHCALAWMLFLAAGVLAVLLEEDTFKFTPPIPSDPRACLRLFSGTSAQMLRRASQYARVLGGSERQEAGGEDRAGAPADQKATLASLSGKRFRPGLGGVEDAPKPRLGTPPFFEGDTDTYLSAVTYEQLLRLLSFFQAISVTALIASYFHQPPQDLVEGMFYALTWAQWPFMMFFMVPVLLRRLTFRNSIELKKDVEVIRRVDREGNEALIRDFIVLIRLIGLARWVGQTSQNPERHEAPMDEETYAKQFEELVPQTEQVELWNIFAVWDAENCGKVSVIEMGKTFEVMGLPHDVSMQAARDLISVVDREGSGTLTWSGFKALTVLANSSTLRPDLDKDLERFFELVDANQDGVVTLTELTQALRRMRIGLQPESVCSLVYKHFSEVKSYVTRDEFVDWARSSAPTWAR